MQPTALSSATQPEAFHDAKARIIEAFEQDYLSAMLTECGGVVRRAAERSGLSERNFCEKLKRHGICWKRFCNGRALRTDAGPA